MSIFGIQHWERPWSDILVLESRRGLGNFPLLQVTFTLICSIQMQLHFSLSLQKLQSTVKAKLAPLKYTFLTLGWNIFHFSVGRTALPTGATEETLPFSWAADALPWANLPLLIPQHHSFGVIPAPQEKGRPAYFSGPEQYLFKKKKPKQQFKRWLLFNVNLLDKYFVSMRWQQSRFCAQFCRCWTGILTPCVYAFFKRGDLLVAPLAPSLVYTFNSSQLSCNELEKCC